MFKVVETGGPCGGKSKSLLSVAEKIEERGYKVITIEEGATKLMRNGIIPGENISLEDFQEFVLDEQLHNERIAERAALMYEKTGQYKGVVILSDRGLADQMAYIPKETFEKMLKRKGLTISDAYAYDCVIHLLTAADGAVDFYEWAGSKTCENRMRSEPPEEAIRKDRLTQNAWTGSSHFQIIDNSTDFKAKIAKSVAAVFRALGEPTPLEIERKFIIRRPTIEDINSLGWNSRSEIVQTYLKEQEDGVERRVRQRGTKADGFKFYYTEKKYAGYGTRSEDERRIDADEYISYLAEADTSLHQILKERYCFLHGNRQFEMDLYPFSEKCAILEIEVDDINEQIDMPDGLEILKDVTDDARYKNHTIAKTMDIDFECL